MQRTKIAKRNWGGVAVLLVSCLVLAGCGNKDSGQSAAPDTNPPVITSGPTISSLTEYSARVTWTTDELSTSTVRFGISTSYDGTQESATPATEHSIMVTSLSPYTLYHYRVESVDGAGNGAMSSDGEFTTDHDLALYLSEGWSYFDAGDLAAARTSFQGALGKDSASAQAYLGLAWTDRGGGDEAAALIELDTALSCEAGYVEALAARAGVKAELAQWTEAQADAEGVLAQDPDYVCAYIPYYDYLDLHVVLARAYYEAADYAAAQAEVDILNPHNPLDPYSPGYEIALQAAINQLYAAITLGSTGGGGKPPSQTAGGDS